MELNNIIFFDGICNFCNSTVNFIIKKDSKELYLFSPLQSEFALNFFAEKNYKVDDIDSIILFNNNQFLIYSDAILLIVKNLQYPFKLLFGFIIIPKFLRNMIYKFIAKNRYKLFGVKASCIVPNQR